MRKIKDTSYLCGVLPQASSWPMVRDCIPWTASRPPVYHAVASTTRSFAPSVAATEAAIGLYLAHVC